ncbi:MAG: peptidase S10 [Bacteroidota bacterium]|nr:peptidase S10 [Bacteroidota bacterium]
MKKLLLLAGIFFISGAALLAQRTEHHAPAKITKDSSAPAIPDHVPPPVVTRSSVTINGKVINYTATTGYMIMKDEEGKPKANIFFIAYTKDDIADKATRPLTFAYNGGPGSSSVWLHMGLIGPRRVELNDTGEAMAPPYRYVNNEYSWLDKTDVIFIDPVTTGYSRQAKGEDVNQFHGYQEDITSVGDFIRQYVSKYERWGSPKFLAGESYGTTRSAGLSGYLQDKYGMYLNGIVLISSVLNFETLNFSRGNDLPYILFLPTYAASAWYHHKIAPDLQGDLQKALAEAKEFAGNEYTIALMKGDQVSPEEKTKVINEMHRLTGLSEEYISRSNLRVDIEHFCKELLRDEGKSIGRYDSRLVNTDYDDISPTPDNDPSYSAVLGAFSGAINEYLAKDLKFQNPETPYNILTSVWPWPYNSDNRYFYNSETLRKAMTDNKYLKVWIVCGDYDLATPFFAAEYVAHHMGLRPYQQSRLHFTYYQSGHMVYLNHPSLVKLKKDVDEFYDSAVSK